MLFGLLKINRSSKGNSHERQLIVDLEMRKASAVTSASFPTPSDNDTCSSELCRVESLHRVTALTQQNHHVG